MSSDEVRSVFEQAVTGMSEYYKGTTPVGEQLYYAGGADGENAILVLVVPESSASAVFIGPATVGDDNKLTVQDETTGSSISFAVIDNGRRHVFVQHGRPIRCRRDEQMQLRRGRRRAH